VPGFQAPHGEMKFAFPALRGAHASP